MAKRKPQRQRVTLVRFTLLAAFTADEDLPSMEEVGNELAEYVRGAGALTVCSDMDDVTRTIRVPEGDDDVLVDALAETWPGVPYVEHSDACECDDCERSNGPRR